MTFTVAERLILLNILPVEGDIFTLRLVRKLREALSFSEEEHKLLEFRQTPETIQWKLDAPVAPKEIEVGPKMLTLIADTLNRLSDSKKLREQWMDLYDRFNPPE